MRAVLVTNGQGRPAPSCIRVVPLPDGFACFLHHRGATGLELAANPGVSLAFDWPEQGRTVVATGRCGRLSAVDSDAFFGGLAEREQLAVWAGGEQRENMSRAAAAGAFADFADYFSGQLIPRPQKWGGYRIAVDEMRFQQESDDGVTDSFRYGKTAAAGDWYAVRTPPL
ncbi:pyridoxamine 5'-phosphate oxidase family protein [Streptomyces sp. NPDC020883]|uniref:pyridoxamine 5'-phosphate oxidase family protein n=1 Tax=Streptomyces sp. NPDC020883 TaxID=3365099 RepID=UPI00379E2D9B